MIGTDIKYPIPDMLYHWMVENYGIEVTNEYSILTHKHPLHQQEGDVFERHPHDWIVVVFDWNKKIDYLDLWMKIHDHWINYLEAL